MKVRPNDDDDINGDLKLHCPHEATKTGPVATGSMSSVSGTSVAAITSSSPPSSPEGPQAGCSYLVDAWRPSPRISEISQATFSVRDVDAHDDISTWHATVVLQMTRLNSTEVTKRGGGKFKLLELRSC